MDSSASHNTTQPAYAEDFYWPGKRLILVRHADAVQEGSGGDHLRSLSEDGRGEAVALAAWLVENHIRPDLALCSTAARARQTLAALLTNVPTIFSDRLYLATPGEMIVQIQATDNAVQTLLVVGHNPGVHALAATLTGKYLRSEDADQLLLEFPTSACAVFQLVANSWLDIGPDKCQLSALFCPREI